MTSKERVRNALERKSVDRVPAHFECTAYVMDSLKKHFNTDQSEDVLRRLDIDIRSIDPLYTGPELKKNQLTGKNFEITTPFGSVHRHIWNGKEYNNTIVHHPLNEAETPEDVETMMTWPKEDWFDYESIKGQLAKHEDKAIIFGHWGPFQTATNLRSEDKLYMDMAINPELTRKIFDKMHDFEMWHYENILKAGDGQIDILRTHDDYGTQRSMLFSLDMWKEYFREHTRELVELAHKYGAYFQQHSCGAVKPVIPHLIECGIDSLEPLQPVTGMDPEGLFSEFGEKLTFCGGIDTQHLLPFGTTEEVKEEVKRYIDVLGQNNGYILYPSQAWESCVPLKNIEAFYNIRD